MKRNQPFLLTTLIGCLVFSCLAQVRGESLTPEQLSQIKEKLAELRDVIENRHSQLNTSAADVFLNASQDPSSAVDLYVKCYKMVNFDREDRDRDEFEEWEDRQRARFKDPRFHEGLQTQLRYMALSCRAAESESMAQVFPSLLSYVDGLMRLTEMPSPELLQNISGTVFAKAYQIEKLLAEHGDWEGVPFNVSGIYDKAVLPYLRANEVEKLMGAWDRRIQHQTQLVEFLEEFENRGNRRDDRQKSQEEVRQMQGGRTGGIIKAHDKDDFIRDTLPSLQLGKLRDMYGYVDQAQGAAGLLAFIEANIEHEKGAEWLKEIADLLMSSDSLSEPTDPISTAPPRPATPPARTPTGGSVPAGLVPAN